VEHPKIGITPDIEWRTAENPPRPYYELDHTLVSAVKAAGGCPILLPHEPELVKSYLNGLNGIVVSGDNYRFTSPGLFAGLEAVQEEDVPAFKLNRTRFEIALINEALQQDIPILAICAGFQILNVVMGGTVVVDINSDPAVFLQHRQTEAATVATHPIAIQSDTLLRRIIGQSSTEINSIHSQSIRLAPDAVASALSPDGLIEAIEVPTKRFCIGTQWHPEFLAGDGDGKIIEGLIEASRSPSSHRK